MNTRQINVGIIYYIKLYLRWCLSWNNAKSSQVSTQDLSKLKRLQAVNIFKMLGKYIYVGCSCLARARCTVQLEHPENENNCPFRYNTPAADKGQYHRHTNAQRRISMGACMRAILPVDCIFTILILRGNLAIISIKFKTHPRIIRDETN